MSCGAGSYLLISVVVERPDLCGVEFGLFRRVWLATIAAEMSPDGTQWGYLTYPRLVLF